MTEHQKVSRSELEHREGSEDDGWYCWCLPKIEKIVSRYGAVSYLVVHNAPNAKGATGG